jgi:hypothetical protein
MKFVKQFWVKWDRKLDFWGNFGRVLKREPKIEFPGTGGSPGEHVLRHGEQVLNNT